MMLVLGIDPSLTCTGAALTTGAGEIEPRRFQTGAGDGSLLDLRGRVRYIVGSILRWMPELVDLTVIEKPIIPRHGSGQVLERAWLFGMLVDQLVLRGPVAVVHPMTRAKYGAGNGNANKADVLVAVRAAFPNLRIQDDNEADALALAAMGARHLGEPIDGVASKAQLAAMSAVTWPPMKGTN